MLGSRVRSPPVRPLVEADDQGTTLCRAFRILTLVPSRYIEFVDRDTELDYDTALKEVGTKAAELLKRQAENATRLEAAFRTLGVKL